MKQRKVFCYWKEHRYRFTIKITCHVSGSLYKQTLYKLQKNGMHINNKEFTVYWQGYVFYLFFVELK